MNFTDLFRGFLGFRNPRESHRFDHSEPEDPFGLMPESDDFFNFEREVEELFRNFGFGDFPFRHEIDQPPESLPHHPESRESSSLRDRMLKPLSPDAGTDDNHDDGSRRQFSLMPPSIFGGLWSTPFPSIPAIEDSPHIDEDLDGKVQRSDLDSLFAQQPGQQQPRMVQSHFKSTSVRTVRLPDGRVEHHSTARDSEGNLLTTTTRTLGDQTHTVTVKTDQSGTEEKLEEFVNMDEKNLGDFDDRWKNLASGHQLRDRPRMGSSPLDKSDYDSVLDKFFRRN